MGKYMSSRPDDDDASFSLEELNHDELCLISAFLYQTKLGSGISSYRDAAFSLLDKISDIMGDDFVADAADDVDMQIVIQDSAGNMIDRVAASNVEFEV